MPELASVSHSFLPLAIARTKMLAAAQLLPALRRCCCWRRPPPLLVPLVPLVLLAALLLAAAAHVAPSLGRSTCRMAWMSPAYVLLPGMRSADPHASRWRLLLYREQGWDQPGHAVRPSPCLELAPLPHRPDDRR